MLTTNKLLQKGCNPIISIFLLTCPPPLHPGCPAIPGLSQHHLEIAIPTIALHTQCLFFPSWIQCSKHQTVFTAVCNLCTLLNGEGWTRAHFSLTVFHLSESAPWQVYIFLIGIWILTRDLRKRTWGGEFLGPGLDNRGELDWGLPHTPASANFLKRNQPTSASDSGLAKTATLSTAARQQASWNCSRLRNGKDIWEPLKTSLRCEGWGCLRSASNLSCTVEWNSVTWATRELAMDSILSTLDCPKFPTHLHLMFCGEFSFQFWLKCESWSVT